MNTILIIEDEILIQQSLKKLFERKGLKVDVSASGKLAIDLILNNYYDRIICDLMLQDISGFDVIEESKKKFSPEEISKKFVIMTAYNFSINLLMTSNRPCEP
jgi:DNA-binding response OmpR family regulator